MSSEENKNTLLIVVNNEYIYGMRNCFEFTSTLILTAHITATVKSNEAQVSSYIFILREVHGMA